MSKAPVSQYYRTSKLLNTKTSTKTVSIELPPAHPKQFELINSFDSRLGIRFVVGACGTKFGVWPLA